MIRESGGCNGSKRDFESWSPSSNLGTPTKIFCDCLGDSGSTQVKLVFNEIF